MEPTLRTKLAHHLHELPLLPGPVAQLLALDRDDPDYADRVVELVGAEPNFSARVLSAANSAASAPVSPITTLGAAVARIGSTNASDLVLAIGVTRVFVPRDDWERALWRHAVQVGIAARALVARKRPAGLVPDQAYVAGLLHDIGRFVLFREAPEKLRLVDEGDWDRPEALVALETEICGLDHAELGALACRRWSIPDPIAFVVANHHRVAPVGGDARDRLLTAIVRVADLAMFPSAMVADDDYTTADLDTIESVLCSKLPAEVAMGPEQLRELIVSVVEESSAVMEAIGIG